MTFGQSAYSPPVLSRLHMNSRQLLSPVGFHLCLLALYGISVEALRRTAFLSTFQISIVAKSSMYLLFLHRSSASIYAESCSHHLYVKTSQAKYTSGSLVLRSFPTKSTSASVGGHLTSTFGCAGWDRTRILRQRAFHASQKLRYVTVTASSRKRLGFLRCT